MHANDTTLTELQRIILRAKEMKECANHQNEILDLIIRLAREVDSVLQIATAPKTTAPPRSPITLGTVRDQVIAVFGDACPVCTHSVTGAHRIDETCELCGTNCGDRHWPPENIQRFNDYYNLTRPPEQAN